MTKKEEKEAIWECGSTKSPRSDGYNFKFIKRFRSVLKHDIMRFVEEFHTNGVFPMGTNASFVTFIPKVVDPQDFGDFRPISLVGCMYKVVAKIHAKRIKGVLNDVIH